MKPFIKVNNFILFNETKRKIEDTCFVLFSRSLNSLDVLRESVFFRKMKFGVDGFFVERKLTNLPVIDKEFLIWPQTAVYNEVKQKSIPGLARYFRMFSNYRGINNYRHLKHELTAFYDPEIRFRGIASKNFYEMIKTISNEISEVNSHQIWIINADEPIAVMFVESILSALRFADKDKEFLLPYIFIYAPNEKFTITVPLELEMGLKPKYEKLLKFLKSRQNKDDEDYVIEKEEAEESKNLLRRKYDYREKLIAEISRELEIDPSHQYMAGILIQVDQHIDSMPLESFRADLLPEEASKILENSSLKSAVNNVKKLKREKEREEEKVSRLISQFETSDITINGKSIKVSDLLSQTDEPLKPHVIDDPNISSDPRLRESKTRNFNSQYAERMMFADALKCAATLSQDKTHPMVIKSFDFIDKSDSQNKMWDLRITFIDKDRRSHTVHIDFPKPDKNGFFFLNGQKKYAAHQFIAFPVVKFKPDEVQLLSYYNKAICRRTGSGNVSDLVRRLSKLLKAPDVDHGKKLKVVIGDTSKKNSLQNNTMRFNSLASEFISIKVGDIRFEFDNDAAYEKAMRQMDEKQVKKFDKEYPEITVLALAPEGFWFRFKDEIYFRHKKEGSVESTGVLTFMDLLIGIIDSRVPEFIEALNKESPTRKMIHCNATISRRTIPIIIMCAVIEESLTAVLDKYGVNYHFEEKKPKLSEREKLQYNEIKFQNGTLYYDNSRIEVVLLMNGLTSFRDYRDINFEDLSDMKVLGDILSQRFSVTGSVIMDNIRNFHTRFVDPTTLEILEGKGLPTNFSDLLLYANTLMKDNTHDDPVDPKFLRVRPSLEMLNHLLYQNLTQSYNTWKRMTTTSAMPQKLNIKPSIVVDKLNLAQNVENLSILNPLIELDAVSKVSSKGPGGINESRAFTSAYRKFHPNMYGLFTMYSPMSSTVAIVRNLGPNPKIKTMRGFVDVDNELPIDKTNTESLVERMIPFMRKHDDAPRIIMGTTQFTHFTGTQQNDMPLFGDGAHKMIAHMLPDDYTYKAKTDGIIKAIDEKNKVVIIEYKDGTKGTVDLEKKFARNTKASFSIPVKLNLDPKLRVGSKVKANQILAHDNSFFKEGGDLDPGVGMGIGVLTKIAKQPDAGVYEDGIIITETLARKMRFRIVDDFIVSLGVNADVRQMVSKGDSIQATMPLITYEVSFEEETLSEVVRKMGEDEDNAFLEYGRKQILSDYTGEVVDIEVYYNRPIEELSPSLKKIVKDYIKENRERSEIMKDSDDILKVNPVEQFKYRSIGTTDFDGVYIKISVEHLEDSGSGNKANPSSPLKGVFSNIIPEDKAPVSEHTDGIIEAILSPESEISRMTPSFNLNLYTNKLIVELKRQCLKMWEEE